jgi:TonB family protein
MKTSRLFPAVLLGIASLFCLAGCAAPSQRVVKDRGVYTTLAMEGHNLDLPGSGYTSCKAFGPGQTPTAVIVGYGHREGGVNQLQPFQLEVVEAASGTVIVNENGNASAGKVAMLDLPIRKSGNYKLKLIIDNSVYDTWDFTVNREAADGDTAGAANLPVYAQGIFGISIESPATEDAFSHYDDSLNRVMLNAVTEESMKSNKDIFAQVPPGKVVVQFDLNETGSIASLKIISNTLNEALGQFFLRALRNAAPYPAWPADVRAAFGSGTRAMEVTFRYD